MLLHEMQHPLPHAHLFLRVVDLGSIRAAAREAGMEPSSVSRRMTALEHRLGAKLIERAQGAARPTEAGLRYATRLRGVLDQLTAIEAEVAGETDTPRGTLRVNASIDFGQRFVSDWLLRFRESYPDVSVELQLSSRNVDLTVSGMDLAIRAGQQADSALRARRIGTLPRVLVAAPGYLKRHGTPAQPEDLADHQHVFFHPEHRRVPLRLTGPDGREKQIMRQGGVAINAISSVAEAVRRGAGIHLGPLWAFHQMLAEGEVVEIFPDHEASAFPLYAVWAPTPVLPARIRKFVDFAAETAKTLPGIEP